MISLVAGVSLENAILVTSSTRISFHLYKMTTVLSLFVVEQHAFLCLKILQNPCLILADVKICDVVCFEAGFFCSSVCPFACCLLFFVYLFVCLFDQSVMITKGLHRRRR